VGWPTHGHCWLQQYLCSRQHCASAPLLFVSTVLPAAPLPCPGAAVCRLAFCSILLASEAAKTKQTSTPPSPRCCCCRTLADPPLHVCTSLRASLMHP